jgi:hypothetical protein
MAVDRGGHGQSERSPTGADDLRRRRLGCFQPWALAPRDISKGTSSRASAGSGDAAVCYLRRRFLRPKDLAGQHHQTRLRPSSPSTEPHQGACTYFTRTRARTSTYVHHNISHRRVDVGHSHAQTRTPRPLSLTHRKRYRTSSSSSRRWLSWHPRRPRPCITNDSTSRRIP